MGYRLSFYKDRQRQWRWRVRASNGKKVANCGEGYMRLRDCRRSAKRLFAWFTER